MDDPWGSPWASTDAHPDNGPPPSARANSFLSPPPKAFFGSGANLSPQSPWPGNRDDDGFNIWTAPDRADGADSQPEWGVWGESAVQPPRLSPRLSTSGKESPLAWPENAAPSPVFFGQPRSRTPSILRHASPDPWAAEVSLTNRSDADLPGGLKVATSDASTNETRRVEQASPTFKRVSESDAKRNINDEQFTGNEARAYTENGGPGASLDSDHPDTDTGSKQDAAVFEPPSRPSSTCSINSHDGPERQDSPITSIDEDRGARMQNNLRKTSGKVQELVGIYNGLARAASEEPPVHDRRGTSRTPSRGKSPERDEAEVEDDEDGVGFGDFEDAFTSAGKATPSPGEAFPTSEFPSTHQTEDKDVFARTSWREGDEEGTKVAETAHVQPEQSVDKFRAMVFDTKLADLDKLFPDLPESPASRSAEDWEISDHIISDSFATISERKSWYRISRFGSMRKHNSGDDENYHRVTWRTSRLHDDTIKIVRRWMEEDSYAGKATLGGTKRTGFFNWDSDATPVKLDEVFPRRKSITKHARTTSIPVANAPVKSAPALERPYRNSTGISLPKEPALASPPIMPAPNFGWNSGTPTTRPLQHGNQKINSIPAPASAAGRTTNHHIEPIRITPTNDDDDDWGEMVSSPRATDAPAEPSVSPFPFAQTTEKNESTSQISPTISKPTGPTSLEGPAPKPTQSTPSDPWLFSDFSILDKPKQPHDRPRARAPVGGEELLNSGANTSLPNEKSLEISNRITIPLKQTTKDPTSVDPPENDTQDDVIVQKILQNLPDLSYMLR